VNPYRIGSGTRGFQDSFWAMVVMIDRISEFRILIDSEDFESLEKLFAKIPIDEWSRVVSRLPVSDQRKLLAGIRADIAADVVHAIPDVQSVEVIAELSADTAIPILSNLPSAERADIVGDLSTQDANAILKELPKTESDQLRELAEYDDEVAGGLMTTEFLAFGEDQDVNSVIVEMRHNVNKYSDFQVQYAYVVDVRSRLVGVLRLRDLLLSDNDTKLNKIMIQSPVSLVDTTELTELRRFFDDHAFVGVPVTNVDGVLLGVVDETDVEEAWANRNAEDYRKSQGIVQEELRTMPLLLRSRRRLAWLSINIVLNMGAASVIAAYQETLTQVIALAVFLPIISDMSGCSGNQAVAVSMRELSLGVVRPTEVWFVWLKEISLGVINGLALGILIATIGFVWKGNPWLGLVIGSAMMINTMVAVSIGGVLPLVMRLLKLDPALASGPILTTVTDMCGFLLVLGLATVLLDKLV